ncbi:Spherulation-specific family 4-domain-containing protein [Bombardia bombarda]|uniref:Spherulation-specific family 4-domain-containing protein n=1 Tax=Bombardia bombarda TaxID=252184 RepID=A0AA39XL27_9PEZI|nr:Spherulation-specific family 4-domain-containing protein [Bombardia bombarda]
MKLLHYLTTAAALSTSTLALDVLLPLYTYPGGTTSLPDWQAAVDAIKANPTIHFYVILNPNNGPTGSGCDLTYGCNRDWTTGIAKLTALPNAQTLGYVYTRYGDTAQRSVAAIKADINNWAAWATAPTWDAAVTANIKVHGIFFDETGPTAATTALYRNLTTYARSTFGARAYATVLNPGGQVDRNAEAALFSYCSAIVLQETCWTSAVSTDCPAGTVPFSYAALKAGSGLPYDAGLRGKTSVLVHQFHGAAPTADNATLLAQLKGVAGLGLHSTYFTSADWSRTTVAPAPVGVFAALLKQARSAVAARSAVPGEGAEGVGFADSTRQWVGKPGWD